MATGHVLPDGDLRVDVDGVGSFHMDRAGQLTVERLPGCSTAALERARQRIVEPMCFQARGDEVLHGSAVLTGLGVVAFCGVSGVGKSTLAAALAQAGWAFWADDSVLIELGADGPRVVPHPSRPGLRAPSAAALGSVADISAAESTLGPQPLASVMLPRLSADPAAALVAVEPLRPADRFVELLRHAKMFNPSVATMRERSTRQWLDIAASTAVYRLTIRRGFEHLGAVIAELRNVL